MNSFLLIIIVVISVGKECQSAALQNIAQKDNSTLSLPIPYPKYTKIEDPAHVIVRWDPVKVSADNPILGFKVKLWEDEKKKVTIFAEKDGKLVGVEEWVPVKKSIHILPKHKPAFEAVVPPDVFTASFDVKKGEQYELRAQSYNADGDGPLSNSFGFRIHTDEESELYKATSTKRPIDEKDNVKIIVLSSNIDD